MYKRYERLVGNALEDAAVDSCKLAAAEERRLVIEKIDECCKKL